MGQVKKIKYIYGDLHYNGDFVNSRDGYERLKVGMELSIITKKEEMLMNMELTDIKTDVDNILLLTLDNTYELRLDSIQMIIITI